MIQHQRVQTDLLQHLLSASGISIPRSLSLDSNKKGDKEPLPSLAELVRRIPPPFYTEQEKKRRAAIDSIEGRLEQILAKQSSSQSTTTAIPTTFPTTTTILKVIKPEI